MTDAARDEAWERRVAEAWATFGERTDGENRALIETLAAERPEGSAEASFERACVLDTTGASGAPCRCTERRSPAASPRSAGGGP